MNILCVHQGFELYGSDRCFVESVAAIRKLFPAARICVLVPRDGPLLQLLRPLADDVRVARLWIARKSGFARLMASAAVTFPLALARAVGNFRRNDLIYINTVTVIDFIVAARFFRSKALLHVHEAPEGLIGSAIGFMVRASRPPMIFNSRSTQKSYQLGAGAPSYVLYNGVEGRPAIPAPDYDGRRKLKLLMIGRLSRAKGQDLLIEALGLLAPAIRERVSVRVVGSAFDPRAGIEEDLKTRAKSAGCAVDFEPFAVDPWPIYEWCDLAVVPSRVREGFGRIPVEAAACGRASIVAAHGGLTEIIVPGESGWHFAPEDARALASAITQAVENPERVRAYGQAGRERFDRIFTAERIERQLQDIVRQQTTAINGGERHVL